MEVILGKGPRARGGGRVFKVLDPPQPPLKRGEKESQRGGERVSKSPFLRGI